MSTPETSVEAKVTTPRVDLGRVTTPTYALIGATDLAVERARRLTADLVALPGRTVNGIISAPGAVLAAGLTSVSRAQRGYEDLAEREVTSDAQPRTLSERDVARCRNSLYESLRPELPWLGPGFASSVQQPRADDRQCACREVDVTDPLGSE